MSTSGDFFIAVHRNTDGCHEVHVSTCLLLPTPSDRRYLGEHEGCHDAITIAQLYFGNCTGCPECSPDCAGSERHEP